MNTVGTTKQVQLRTDALKSTTPEGNLVNNSPENLIHPITYVSAAILRVENCV